MKEAPEDLFSFIRDTNVLNVNIDAIYIASKWKFIYWLCYSFNIVDVIVFIIKLDGANKFLFLEPYGTLELKVLCMISKLEMLIMSLRMLQQSAFFRF